MFDIPVEGSRSRKSGPINNALSRTGSFGGAASQSGPITHNSGAKASYSSSGLVSSVGVSGSSTMKKTNSGPLSKHGEPIKKSSGPQSGGATPLVRQNSGPLPPVLPTTGLITSGPISSCPLSSSGAPRKIYGPLDSMGPSKGHASSVAKNPAVTTLGRDDNYSKWWLCTLSLLEFYSILWNSYRGRRAVVGYIARYPDAEPRTAKNGQYVKVSGVVTCGNIPLESSFQKVPRCVYTSTTSLFEYRGWDSKAANRKHRRFTWGARLRSSERHVVDFYISD